MELVSWFQVFIRETYAGQILRRRAAKLRKEKNDPRIHCEYESADRHWTRVLGRGMVKPWFFLATEPIVQVLALYMAVLYGLLYLTLTGEYQSIPFNQEDGSLRAGQLSSIFSRRNMVRAMVLRVCTTCPSPLDQRVCLLTIFLSTVLTRPRRQSEVRSAPEF